MWSETGVTNVFKKVGRWVYRLFAAIGVFTVIVIALPIPEYLAKPLRQKSQLEPAEAIVVLGGGAFKDGLPSVPSVVRSVYGLSLFQKGYAPRILLAGGQPSPEYGWEGLAMKKLLEDLGASSTVLETEDRSTRTYSNAQESARILQREGAGHILLVTHPNHMLRARRTFEKAGFTVSPAPIPWERLPARPIRPSISRITLLHNVLYEYTALLLYWWRGWL